MQPGILHVILITSGEIFKLPFTPKHYDTFNTCQDIEMHYNAILTEKQVKEEQMANQRYGKKKQASDKYDQT